MKILDTEAIQSVIASPQQIVVLSHRNPDGDALGSSLAWSAFLRKLGHTVKVIFPSDFPLFYNWLQEADSSLIFDNFPDEAREVISNADQIHALDFNSWERVDPLQLQLLESTAIKVVIDHHLDPEPHFDHYYVDDQASSTAELIFRLIEDLDGLKKMDRNMGEALYTGLVTDTGSFKFSISSEVFRVAGKLLETGIDAGWIQNKIFDTLQVKHLDLLGHCLSQRLKILPDVGAGYIYITLADHNYFNLLRGDTEGLVNYILKVKGINVAALIKEQKGYVKFSLRSKGEFSVQRIATAHFNGGGHKNASGGRLNTSLDKAIKTYVKVVTENKKEILHSFQ